MAFSEDQSALEGIEATIIHTHLIHTCLKLHRTVKKEVGIGKRPYEYPPTNIP